MVLMMVVVVVDSSVLQQSHFEDNLIACGRPNFNLAVKAYLLQQLSDAPTNRSHWVNSHWGCCRHGVPL